MSITQWGPIGALLIYTHGASGAFYQFANLWLILYYDDRDFCLEICNRDTLYIVNINTQGAMAYPQVVRH